MIAGTQNVPEIGVRQRAIGVRQRAIGGRQGAIGGRQRVNQSKYYARITLPYFAHLAMMHMRHQCFTSDLVTPKKVPQNDSKTDQFRDTQNYKKYIKNHENRMFS